MRENGECSAAGCSLPRVDPTSLPGRDGGPEERADIGDVLRGSGVPEAGRACGEGEWMEWRGPPLGEARSGGPGVAWKAEVL